MMKKQNDERRCMGWLKVGLRILSWIWIVALAAIGVSRFFAPLAWRVDLLANVSYFIAGPALVTAIGFLSAKRWARGGLSALITLIAAWPVLPQFWPNFDTPKTTDVKIYICNIFALSPDIPAVIESIVAADPDLVVLLETGMHRTRSFVEHPALAERYPFGQAPRHGETWPILIMSRWPTHAIEFDDENGAPTGLLDAGLDELFAYHRSVFIDSPAVGRLLLSASHPPSPRTPDSWYEGNETIRKLCDVVRNDFHPTGAPIIVAGDFNTSPAGLRHRLMEVRSGLHPAAGAGAFAGTWPSDLPGWLRLSLDQVWGSDEIDFIDREVLDDVGSDHRPILVTFRARGD